MKQIKYGIWGLGRIGFVHAYNFSAEKDKFQLVAGCDRDPERVALAEKEFGCAGYGDPDAFLSNPDMELVIIATRSRDHVVHARQALAADKIVLLEKPIATNEQDYQALLKINDQYAGKLFFLHNHRFEPAFEHVRRIVVSGILGEVHTVKLCRHHPFRRRADWQSLLEFGGGQLHCWGPHILDHALQFLGGPVKDVWSNLKRIHSLGDADDHVKIVLLGENGRVVDLEISDGVAIPGAYCSVYGTRGTLVCQDEERIALKYVDPDYQFQKLGVNAGTPGGCGVDEEIPWREENIPVEPAGNKWELVERAIARHLYRAIREGIPFPIRNADALEVVRVTELVKKKNNQFDWKS